MLVVNKSETFDGSISFDDGSNWFDILKSDDGLSISSDDGARIALTEVKLKSNVAGETVAFKILTVETV